MAKKNALDWTLAPESKGPGHIDQFLVWVSGSLLTLTALLGSIDILDFIHDPGQHAIGQGMHADDSAWKSQYLITGTSIVAGAIISIGVLLFCAGNPEKRWTKYMLRVTSVVVIGAVAMGYISWMCGGFDH